MPMSKEIDGKLFAAALCQITHIWGREMDDLQKATLANQIVREIDRRMIVDEIKTDEREACAAIASDRAAVCRAAYDAGDKTEVHPLNEALHIAHLIRNRKEARNGWNDRITRWTDGRRRAKLEK